MNNTMKLCNFRDCTTEEHKSCPHNAVDPCKVFRHAETGHWYDEMTGQPVRHFRTESGKMFDVQLWLEEQMVQAATTWEAGDKVHEEFRSKDLRPSGATRPAARAPEYSNQELDAIADAFIRNKHEKKALIDDMRECGAELHGLVRMRKTWGNHPLLDQRISEVQEQRDAIMQLQSEMDRTGHIAKKHLKDDNKWTNRWRPLRGNWNDFVLMCEHDGRLFVIDRHGLKVDGQYLYLPEEDKKFFESALWAQSRLGIIQARWEKMPVAAEKIGPSARRYGKKNANGRRINARADQIKYAGSVEDTIAALRQMHVSVLRIRDDDELFEYYLKNIAPSLSRG